MCGWGQGVAGPLGDVLRAFELDSDPAAHKSALAAFGVECTSVGPPPPPCQYAARREDTDARWWKAV